MFETWVLIFFLTGSGKSIATIPGYASHQECQSAIDALGRDQFSYSRCIPGPKKQQP